MSKTKIVFSDGIVLSLGNIDDLDKAIADSAEEDNTCFVSVLEEVGTRYIINLNRVAFIEQKDE